MNNNIRNKIDTYIQQSEFNANKLEILKKKNNYFESHNHKETVDLNGSVISKDILKVIKNITYNKNPYP